LRKDQKFGGEAKLWDDISEALIQQDILPFWHEHYKAISFQPLGRVDIRRSLNVGTIQENDLEPLYQQLGYSDSDAKSLAKFALRERDNAIIRHKWVKLWLETLITRPEAQARLIQLGFPLRSVVKALDVAQYDFDASPPAQAFQAGGLTRNQLIAELMRLGVDNGVADNIANKIAYKKRPSSELREYEAGLIDRQPALNVMVQKGMRDDIANTLLDEVDATNRIAQVLRCQSAIRRRFTTGEIDKMAAEVALTRSGTTQQAATRLVNGWACEMESGGKDAAIPKLCNWLARGAINPADFLRRVKRLGYDDADAALIMEDCLISVNAKRNAEAKRQAKEDAAAAAARQRKIEQAAAKAQQAYNALARAQKQREATTQRREKQLLSAAEKIIKKCDCPLEQAYRYAMESNKRIQSEYALSKDESLQALISAVDGWDGLAFDDLTLSVDLAASLLQVSEPELAD
jgi:hypothetical protein